MKTNLDRTGFARVTLKLNGGCNTASNGSTWKYVAIRKNPLSLGLNGYQFRLASTFVKPTINRVYKFKNLKFNYGKQLEENELEHKKIV